MNKLVLDRNSHACRSDVGEGKERDMEWVAIGGRIHGRGIGEGDTVTS
jgi:hypothetical protein